ncbi:AI-2E family transporter [Helicobacter acinonychis]|uniref:AmaA protein n=1 Tax=Helicobacter acinonychis (strain Sheeba) TaxID=382638 RepID=Q17XP9_HELAH|nr:AI-2E family transporter [Helicobacter acinonychis]CAJ99577.1 amaA [Helicobacter acinonychis str. Sheeba]STP04144.1 Acid membrane antigen A [Helicobacter acinonychis]
MKAQYFFWILFLIGFYWMLYLYQDFLMDVLIAGLLCVGLFQVKVFLDKHFFNVFSSLLCVLVLASVLIVPLYFIIYKSSNIIFEINFEKLSALIKWLKEMITENLSHFPAIHDGVSKFLENFNATSITGYLLKISSYVGKYGLKLITDALLILGLLFFFFYYGERFYHYFLGVLPLQIHQSKKIFEEVAGILRIVLLTSLITVILEGVAFGVMIVWFGHDGWFLGILYGLASLVPAVGGALIWIPIAIYELYHGHVNGAIFIVLYSILLIGGLIDSVLKPFLIVVVKKRIFKTTLKINEMLIFFSMIAGISQFGFWGIIVGPTITAFFIALLRLYENYFIQKEQKTCE